MTAGLSAPDNVGDSIGCAPILYHYPMSPFSEKLRVAMGASGVLWRSVDVPAFPPRTDLSRFIGGYRRIPVLQIGAHFFCDTRLAYQALFGGKTDPTALAPVDEDLRRWAETEVFFAVLSSQRPMAVVRFLTRELGVKGLLRFMRDRMRMMREASVTVPSRTEAGAVLTRYIAVLSERLVTESFLSGTTPGYLDFCCYHPLWMAERVQRGLRMSWSRDVQGWLKRMEALPHGPSVSATESDVEAAIVAGEIDCTGWSVPSSWTVGESVIVAPLDYGLDASSGELAAMSDERIVLRRKTSSGSLVYAHFPQVGFSATRPDEDSGGR